MCAHLLQLVVSHGFPPCSVRVKVFRPAAAFHSAVGREDYRASYANTIYSESAAGFNVVFAARWSHFSLPFKMSFPRAFEWNLSKTFWNRLKASRQPWAASDRPAVNFERCSESKL